MSRIRMSKEKFTKDTPIKKCGMCGETKPVYLETKIKNTHVEETPLCSKICVRRAFGQTPNTKRA